jgi:hypothetical protein
MNQLHLIFVPLAVTIIPNLISVYFISLQGDCHSTFQLNR